MHKELSEAQFFNPLVYLVIWSQCTNHIPTRQLICTGNTLTSFFMKEALSSYKLI